MADYAPTSMLTMEKGRQSKKKTPMAKNKTKGELRIEGGTT